MTAILHKGKIETQSYVLVFAHASTKDTVAGYITCSFPVKSLILKSISVYNLDNANSDPMQMLTFDLLPPSTQRFILYPILPSSNEASYTEYPTQVNPKLKFQFLEPQLINGTYNFKLQKYDGSAISNPTTVNMVVCVQIEYRDH